MSPSTKGTGPRGPGHRCQARARALPARARGTRSVHDRPGRAELGRDRIIRQAYDAVGIITFFTAGEPEVRGWNLERGATAVDAAGKIHTDIAKGFIRAEVTAFDELHAAGSLKEAKAKHLQRLEGKEYIVKDGDVIYFRSGL